MPETLQLVLPGFDPPTPTDRLMFLVYPDPSTAQRIAQEASRLRSSLGLDGALLHAERLHITLHHLGDFVGLPNDIVSKGVFAGDAMAAAPFEVAFDRAASFANRRSANPFTLQGGEGVTDLVAFQKGLGEKMAGAALRPDRSFTPHITLLYDGRIVPEKPIAPIVWRIDRFALVQSKLGRTQHVTLREWTLH